MIFLICTFKDTNLAKNLTNLAENLFDKLNSGGFMDLVFSKSVGPLVGQSPAFCVCVWIFQSISLTTRSQETLEIKYCYFSQSQLKVLYRGGWKTLCCKTIFFSFVLFHKTGVRC